MTEAEVELRDLLDRLVRMTITACALVDGREVIPFEWDKPRPGLVDSGVKMFIEAGFDIGGAV